eukprot:jgi/Chlat1/6914/Chrsp52S06586
MPTRIDSSAPGLVPFDFSQPSPDDAVRAAQQKSVTKKPMVAKPLLKPIAQPKAHASVKAKATREATSPSRGEEQAGPSGRDSSIVDVERLGERFAEVLEPKGWVRAGLPLSSFKPDVKLIQEAGKEDLPGLHLVVVGHVDAGKSTLMGRLLAELGVVTEKQMKKHVRDAAASGKSSFAYAWVLDEQVDERQRGVTIDVATVQFETPHQRVTLLDAPGHRDFVPNMIAGAARADAALLVVDASPGEFEAGFAEGGGSTGGGQTREHAQLARSLGVEQLVVVINKMDLVQYSQQRYTQIKESLAPFLRQCGFKDSSVRWLPAAGVEGQNLAKPPTDPRFALWWSGPHLVEAIDTFERPARASHLPLRITVTDVTRSRTLNAAAAGGKILTVKALERQGTGIQLACAGDIVEVVLHTLDRTDASSEAKPGDVICDPDYPIPVVARFEARILTLNLAIPILRGATVVVHAHNAQESGSISELVALLDPKSGAVAKSKPRAIMKRQSALVDITPARPICLECYSDVRALGRIVLRDAGRTLAVGIVTRILA